MASPLAVPCGWLPAGFVRRMVGATRSSSSSTLSTNCLVCFSICLPFSFSGFTDKIIARCVSSILSELFREASIPGVRNRLQLAPNTYQHLIRESMGYLPYQFFVRGAPPLEAYPEETNREGAKMAKRWSEARNCVPPKVWGGQKNWKRRKAPENRRKAADEPPDNRRLQNWQKNAWQKNGRIKMAKRWLAKRWAGARNRGRKGCVFMSNGV